MSLLVAILQYSTPVFSILSPPSVRKVDEDEDGKTEDGYQDVNAKAKLGRIKAKEVVEG